MDKFVLYRKIKKGDVVKLRSLFLVLIVGFVSLPFVSRAQEDDHLFEQMALGGDVKAQTVVGFRCTDLVQSYGWLSVASGTGNDIYGWFSVAAGHGNETATRALSIVREKLSEKQIEEGRQLAGKLYQEIKQNQMAARKKAEQEIEQNQRAVLQKARQGKKLNAAFNVPASAVVAAFNGDAQAQDTVAGFASDWVQQYAWYSLAAAQGSEHGAKFRAQVLTSMSPKMIEQGEQLIQKLDQEIKQNQVAAAQKVEQEKMAALQKAEQDKEVEKALKEVAKALAESAREIEKQEQAAALQKAEQEKEVVRALAESAKEIEKQKKAVALRREKQEAIQQRKEAMTVWGFRGIKILVCCAFFYAAYLGRKRLMKSIRGPILLILAGTVVFGMIEGVSQRTANNRFTDDGLIKFLKSADDPSAYVLGKTLAQKFFRQTLSSILPMAKKGSALNKVREASGKSALLSRKDAEQEVRATMRSFRDFDLVYEQQLRYAARDEGISDAVVEAFIEGFNDASAEIRKGL